LYTEPIKNPAKEIEKGKIVADLVRTKMLEQGKIQRLERLTDMLDYAINNSTEIVFGLGENRTVVYCNKTAETTFRRNVSEFCRGVLIF